MHAYILTPLLVGGGVVFAACGLLGWLIAVASEEDALAAYRCMAPEAFDDTDDAAFFAAEEGVASFRDDYDDDGKYGKAPRITISAATAKDEVDSDEKVVWEQQPCSQYSEDSADSWEMFDKDLA